MSKDNKNSAPEKGAELNEEQKAVETTAKTDTKKEEAKEEKVSFTLDKKKYEFAVKKFKFKSKEYSAEEAAKDKDLLALLVKTNSFVIKPV
ncbi:hypothetical protein OOZ35_00210 [Mesoflavibacter profundi]|uniref:Uncharacterized protein n=1 Tax=Mesoflavibacter profundi TaxID=2708110 RepID=A0ABT4RVN9_9FLAO|nr:hypothetical protein [Mesoflavibacter profundi]MDA0175908.1 hypothetical protein [Mesoflavibacter profundi]